MMQRQAWTPAPLSLAIAALCSWSFAAAIPLDAPTIHPTGAVPEPIACGDINEDGLVDLAIANTAAGVPAIGDSATILLGAATGAFTTAGDIAVGQRPESILLLDTNGDGHLDIVTANYAGNSVSIVPGNGDGTFGVESRIALAGGPRGLAAGDYNGDGITDLATSNYGGDSVSILIGDGAGSFSISSTVAVGDGPEVVAAAAIDDDAVLDLVTCNARSDNLTFLKGNGSGGFTVARTYLVGDMPRSIVAADLDGDGLAEVLVANNQSNTVTIEKNLGNFSFINQTTLTFSLGGSPLLQPIYLDVADMDGDGITDVLTSWATSDVLTVFRRGPGPFDFESTSGVDVGDFPIGIATPDVQADEDADLVVTSATESVARIFLSCVSDPGIVLDNGEAGTTGTGTWPVSTAPFAYGVDCLVAQDGPQYRWDVPLEEAGEYELYLWWPADSGLSTAVPVEVLHAQGTAATTVDASRDYGIWHSLGKYRFVEAATVIVTAPPGGERVPADAVRARLISEWPPGQAGITGQAAPLDPRISELDFLAAHGRIDVDSALEPQEWGSLTVEPVGPGLESVDITAVTLWADADGNGQYDAALDTKVAGPLAFANETDPIDLGGFLEPISGGETRDFFVVCTLTEKAARADPHTTEMAAIGAIALIFGCNCLRRRPPRPSVRRRCVRRAGLAAACLLAALVLHISGCGGGGGGGSPQRDPLQVQVTGLNLSGQVSGIPAGVSGLPVTGWPF